MPTNNRETGARAPKSKSAADASDYASQSAAENSKPAGGMGLTQKTSEVNDRTRQSDGQRASGKGDTQKTSGAGPAISKRSKDAKAPARKG